ncbi:uncharacterized protein EV699_106193 [Plasticicumulans lactativorans]|uniref:Xcc1710-like domain-containing protein n=1 Tax=Plasticicumulans lactativorans TaxID=1133106 RepID=A0A4V2SD64_9GAMM|nr:Mth938-like domain-containing protein [Plasticicumulans lactativorans]TCO82096.1 uncharacterized protein EV699_106193 [Plasticicumulans lactativorans]
MRVSLDFEGRHNVVRAYGEGYVTVNADTRLECAFVISPQRLITDTLPQRFEDLAAEHFEALIELRPEVVLLGTGARQRFPHPRLTQALTAAGIAVEVMSTDAACRTYNIVAAEGRNAVALLLMI